MSSSTDSDQYLPSGCRTLMREYHDPDRLRGAAIWLAATRNVSVRSEGSRVRRRTRTDGRFLPNAIMWCASELDTLTHPTFNAQRSLS